MILDSRKKIIIVLLIGLFMLLLLLLALTFLSIKGRQGGTRLPEDNANLLPLDQRAGQGLYKQGDQTRNKNNANLQKEAAAEVNLRTQLPIKQDGFSARYSLGNNTYIIKPLAGTDADEAKRNFDEYVKNQGVNPSDLNIVVNTSNSDYFVLSQDFEGKEVGVTQPLEITFSDPVDRERTLIHTEPDVPAFYDFDPGMTRLTIKPAQTWGFDKTIKVVVEAISKDKNGVSLNQDYVYTFKTKPYSGM